MKTKEIEVWVHEKHAIKDCDHLIWGISKKPDYIKAKLVIDVPERKIEVTENELRDAIVSYRGVSYTEIVDHAINKLFFEKNNRSY
jgi:hypothetical protein